MSENPTAYVIKLFGTGALTLRYEPERFDEARDLFEVLSRIEEETDRWLTVWWSVEY